MRTRLPNRMFAASLALLLVMPCAEAPARQEAPRPDGAREGRPQRADRPTNDGHTPGDLRHRLEEARAEVQRLEESLRALEHDRASALPDRPGARAHEQRSRPERPPHDAGAGMRRGGGGPGAGPADGRRDQPALLSPDAEARVLEFLRLHHPAGAAKVESFRERRPMIARRMLAELGGQLRELGAIRDKDPKMFDVRLRAFRIDWEMREAAFEYLRATRPLPPREGDADAPPPADPGALRERLARLADERYGIMLEERALQIEHMGARIDRLREELQASEANRADAVGERVEAMINRLDRQGPAHGRDHDAPPHADRPE